MNVKIYNGGKKFAKQDAKIKGARKKFANKVQKFKGLVKVSQKNA